MNKTRILLLSAVMSIANYPIAIKSMDSSRLSDQLTVKANLRGQDLRTVSWENRHVKSSHFDKAILGRLNPSTGDFYNASFAGAKIDNLDEVKDLFPTFGVLGRIDVVKMGNQSFDGTTLSREDLPTYQAFAQKSDPLGLFGLAYLYETYGTRTQEEEACALYLKAADKGILEAYNNLGWMYENKRGTSLKSTEAALKYYEKAQSHPKGNFNIARLKALSFKDAETQYAVGEMYYKGMGIEPDPSCSFYWYLKAAHQEYAPALYQVGCFLKSGIGVTKDVAGSLMWFHKGAELGHLDSLRQLGTLYYYGEGTGKDLQKSFFYRQKAADYGDITALKDLAWMYETGQGVEKDFHKALSYYGTVAQSTGKVSATYGVARMHDLLGNHQKAVQAYEKAIQQTENRFHQKDSHGGQEHIGALYRLATKYEKGLGIGTDSQKAIELFKRAAKAGHMPSRLKLRLMERLPSDDALVTFADLSGMASEIQINYVKESYRVLQELRINHKIAHTNTEAFYVEELDQFHYRAVGEEVLHWITEDYQACRHVMEKIAQDRQNEEIQVNYEFITFDPYIKYYAPNIHQEIADEEITDEAMSAIFDEMASAMPHVPSYTPQFTNDLNAIKDKFLFSGEGQFLLRKRFVRQYKNWTGDIGKALLAVPADAPHPLRYRQGVAAINFIQNSSRCLDGLSSYLENLETKQLYRSAEDIPLGIRISKLLNQYKESFLDKHKNTANDAVEEAVEAMRLLRERMRLPLGLPGTFSPLLYPKLGQGNQEIYTPEKVMERFLVGGAIPSRPGMVIPPYTPQLMVELLKKSINKNEASILEKEHLNLFISNHKELKKYFEEAFIEFEENEYFDPNAGNEGVFKDALLESILEMHGYLLKKPSHD